MTDSFIKQREKEQKDKFFRKQANRKVRSNNFLKAMKTQFGPNVELFGDDAIRVDKDGTQTVVGNYNEFLQGGGQLQATPKTAEDLRIKKKKKQPELENAVVKDPAGDAFKRMEGVIAPNPNEGLYAFADELRANENRQSMNINIDEMAKYSRKDDRFYDIPEAPNLNTKVSEMAFKGTDSAAFDAVRSKIAKDPSRIQEGLIKSGFTADRLAGLVIKNRKFQANKRKR